MASELVITFRDYGWETSHVTFRGVPIDENNILLQLSEQDTLAAAVADVTLGRRAQTVRVLDRVVNSAQAAATPQSQRENKWLVIMRDTATQELSRIEIPCADMSLLAPNSEEMDSTDLKYTALVQAIQTYHRSPAGNEVSVERVLFVARNR